MKKYDWVDIEDKWQTYWRERDTFRALDPGDPGFDPAQPKFYVLDMFPYPSGAGLHVGHPLGYIATDIVARYKRMTGHNVLHPMGFDAFGLPAEQYAIDNGVHPSIFTDKNVANMRRQLKSFGLSYDWKRELATTDIDYYKWTQWIFLQLFNSYYCPLALRALPIAELEAALVAGQLLVDEQLELVLPTSASAAHARPYDSLNAKERQDVIDGQRLAYLAEVPVNWCPALGTVLANEEVTAEGRSERGNHPVFRRPLKQWMLRITRYAERLLSDLDGVDWPEPIKLMQRNWIGRSEGAAVAFQVVGLAQALRVYTTRPDTLFGATYMVLAPEHELVARITSAEQRATVEAYCAQAATKSELDRQAEAKTKTGVFSGGYAINPLNGQQIPIWIADYVLMGYGTGAIMAVPAHDGRDFEFARQFELAIVPVVLPDERWLREQAAALCRPAAEQSLAALEQDYLANVADYGLAFGGHGVGVNSHNDQVSLDGLPTSEAKAAITAWLEAQGLGRHQVQYKLRDWLFSRQRYWGEPFPILHGEDGSIVGVAAKELPVELPPMEDFSPPRSDDPNVPPEPSLSRAATSWLNVEQDGVRYRRELNTMPQWAGSCWYYLRFIDPHNNEAMVDPRKEQYWMGGGGVDLYVGGAEHAVLHLLYARFWHKVLFDLKHVSTPEPFGRLFNQGYILAYAYQDEREVYVPAEEVEQQGEHYLYQGKPVRRSYGKMGKSLKNAVTPDEMFHEYGCDTLRLYEMYMGPLEVSKPWNTRDIVGVHRFLQRVWRNFFGESEGEQTLLVHDQPAEATLRRLLHKTIKRVTEDMERMRFNTAIAALIELNNALVALEGLPREVAEALALMLAPFTPHFAEELWEVLGHAGSLARHSWPSWDESLLVEEEVELVVQIKGKTRGRLMVAPDADQEAVKAAAVADERLAKYLVGQTIRKVIFVPGRLINFVVG